MEYIGKYKLIEELGRGGMGVVYKAHDPLIDRFVAIKIILEKALENDEIKARFLREARMAGKLSHENLTVIHDLGEFDGKTYIVMEYLEGRDLRSVIKDEEPLTLQQKLEYAKQICTGLHFAHSNNIIHRDIKPENIKILPDGKVKIIDFGIAKPDASSLSKEEREAGTVVTQLGMRIGTPWYMSPEQVKGEPVDRRADIFSFGVLLYEFLTYQKPFEGDDTTVMYRILHEEPDKINLAESGLVEELQQILSQCLAKKPDDRYNDCGKLFTDLDNVFEKAKQEKRIAKLLSEGNALSHNGRFSDAILKFNELLQIRPDHKEANRHLKKLIEQEKESKTFQILSGRIIGEVISHYKIIERLGRGGMGIVFKAEDLNLRRTVALKFLQPELTRNEQAQKRFFQEARAASALDHRNICIIHEINETDDGLIFICMAYYAGETLREKMDRGPIDLSEGLDIATKIATGLAKAHSHEIVHRDIKPANIIITTDGQVKIVDFGLAKLSHEATRLTKTGTTMGTPYYMSPEQVKGFDLDHRSDIWSFGVLLYQLITGEPPFRGEYEAEMLYEIVNKKITSPSSINPEIPAKLEQIITNMLKKNQKERFESMDEIITELKTVQREISEKKESDSKQALQLPNLAQEGEKHLSKGEYEEALTYFNAALKIAPKDKHLTALKKKCETGLRDLQRAKKLFETGKKHFAKGKHQRALDMVIEATELNPNDAELTKYIEDIKTQLEHSRILAEANSNLKQKKYKDAARLYEQVLQIDPECKEALAGLEKIQKKVSLHATKTVVIDSQPKSRSGTYRRSVLILIMILIIGTAAGGLYYFNRSGEDNALSGSVMTSKDSLEQGEKPEEQLIASTNPMNDNFEVVSEPPPDSLQSPSKKTSDRKIIPPVKEDKPDEPTTPNKSPTPKTGHIEIVSNPTGATIFIDEQKIGVTPTTIRDIDTGRHQIVLKKKGFENSETSLNLESATTAKVKGDLKALMGQLRILVRPYGTIYIDNQVKAKNTFVPYSTELPVGPHTLRIEHPNLGTWEKQVQLRSNQVTQISVNFNQQMPVTILSHDPAGGSVWGKIFVDGKDTGLVTPKQLKLTVGQHKIAVQRQGFTLVGDEKVVNVEENMQPLKFILKKE